MEGGLKKILFCNRRTMLILLRFELLIRTCVLEGLRACKWMHDGWWKNCQQTTTGWRGLPPFRLSQHVLHYKPCWWCTVYIRVATLAAASLRKSWPFLSPFKVHFVLWGPSKEHRDVFRWNRAGMNIPNAYLLYTDDAFELYKVYVSDMLSVMARNCEGLWRTDLGNFQQLW